MSLFIGIDSGTQSVKAVVLDHASRKVIALTHARNAPGKAICSPLPAEPAQPGRRIVKLVNQGASTGLDIDSKDSRDGLT